MNALQLKMARVALGLSVRQAAEISCVSHETITRIEAGREDVKAATIEKVRKALEAIGAIFIDENGDGPGVRLTKHHEKLAPIFVDASRSSVLEHGVYRENFLTLQEAVIAYRHLPPERREVATITSAGRTYSSEEIERLRHGDRTQ